jgi:hypothetical protein
VNIKNQVTAIRQENPVLSVETLTVKSLKFFKEGWDMNYTSRSNKINCVRIYETWYY